MYVALSPSVMSVLPHDLSEFVFIDLGAGKGRVLLLASNYNFNKIIGVEFTRESHALMQDNVKQYRKSMQRCYDIETLCQDAVRFDIPSEKCVFFFFNPFKTQPLLKVARNILLSYTASPRKMYILFYNHTSANNVLDIFCSRILEGTTALEFDVSLVVTLRSGGLRERLIARPAAAPGDAAAV
jgi:hypothetical protein